jgi:hypothetical protein
VWLGHRLCLHTVAASGYEGGYCSCLPALPRLPNVFFGGGGGGAAAAPADTACVHAQQPSSGHPLAHSAGGQSWQSLSCGDAATSLAPLSCTLRELHWLPGARGYCQYTRPRWKTCQSYWPRRGPLRQREQLGDGGRAASAASHKVVAPGAIAAAAEGSREQRY